MCKSKLHTRKSSVLPPLCYSLVKHSKWCANRQINSLSSSPKELPIIMLIRTVSWMLHFAQKSQTVEIIIQTIDNGWTLFQTATRTELERAGERETFGLRQSRRRGWLASDEEEREAAEVEKAARREFSSREVGRRWRSLRDLESEATIWTVRWSPGQRSDLLTSLCWSSPGYSRGGNRADRMGWVWIRIEDKLGRINLTQ
jgi:hypothetical protein